MKRWKWGVGIVVLSSVYAGWCYALFHGYVNPILYTSKGIDISHHQGSIDWDELNNGAVDFVYMKATEGNDYLDSQFKQNWSESKRVDIPRGAYLFLTFCSPATEQSDFFIKTVPKEVNALPPVIDVEFRNCKAKCCQELPSNEDIVLRVSTVYDALTEAYDKEPIVYTTPEFYEKHLRTFPHDRFWVASWGIWPFWKPDWMIWQTTAGELSKSNGDIKGIKGFVDRNVLRTRPSDLL